MKISLRTKVVAYLAFGLLFLAVGLIWQISWMIGGGIVAVLGGTALVWKVFVKDANQRP